MAKKVGRPKKQFTAAQLKQIDKAAFNQAKDYTISAALRIDDKTFKAHFSERCAQKRAEGKLAIHQAQQDMISQPVMAIWLGKQHLEQKDVQTIDIASLPPIVLICQDSPENQDNGPNT